MADNIELSDGVVITETQIRTKDVTVPLDSIVAIEARPQTGLRIFFLLIFAASALGCAILWTTAAHVAIKIAGTGLLVFLFAVGAYGTAVGARHVFVWTKERKFELAVTVSPDALKIKEAIENRLEELKLEQARKVLL